MVEKDRIETRGSNGRLVWAQHVIPLIAFCGRASRSIDGSSNQFRELVSRELPTKRYHAKDALHIVSHARIREGIGVGWIYKRAGD